MKKHILIFIPAIESGGVERNAILIANGLLAQGYQISVRSCTDKVHANKLAAYLCRDIGSGGGHLKKAGGRISGKRVKEKYGNRDFKEIIHQLMCEFIDK